MSELVGSTVMSSLRIDVAAATGAGPTSLAAFDDALRIAGVYNYNLVRLSSVIPAGSVVSDATLQHATDPEGLIDLREGARPAPVEGAWGDRLYAVWAFESAHVLGQEAWAGVAWVQDPADGKGLFVEHEGGSEFQVREELAASLSFISRSRGLDHLPQQQVVIGTRCEGEPVGSLVIAPYQTEPWSPADPTG